MVVYVNATGLTIDDADLLSHFQYEISHYYYNPTIRHRLH